MPASVWAGSSTLGGLLGLGPERYEGLSIAGGSEQILQLAAKENETAVEAALHRLMSRDGEPLSFAAVKQIVQSALAPCPVREVRIEQIQLSDYDVLLLAEKGNA